MNKYALSILCLTMFLIIGVTTYADEYTLETFQISFPNIDGGTSWYSTRAAGINNRGEAVGYTYCSICYGLPGSGDNGFVYSNGSFRFFQVPGVHEGNMAAYGINDHDQIVGWYIDSTEHGFIYDLNTGTYVTLDAPGAQYTEADGINNSGQVVGRFWGESMPLHNFIYDAGTYTIDPGTIDYREYNKSGPEPFGGINNRGQFVGITQGPHGIQGFIATPVPEPTSFLLLCTGVVGAIGAMKRRDK